MNNRWTIALAGFVMPFLTGFLGIMVVDQSIIFEAGGRISKGAMPFTDLHLSYGLLTALMQAAFFKLFGISWFSYVLHAAIINGLFALTAWHTLRLLLPEPNNKRAFAGALLAAWAFYPMMGTAFMDNHSFFLGFVAYWAALVAFKQNKPVYWLLCFPCMVLGFYSKPLPLVFWIFPVMLEIWLNRRLFASHFKWMLLGGIAALGVAALPLLLFDAHNFYYYTFQLPFRLASLRMGGGKTETVTSVVTNERYKVWVCLLVLALIFFIIRVWRQDKAYRASYARISAMLLSSVMAAVMTSNTFFPLVAPVLAVFLVVLFSFDAAALRPLFLSKWVRGVYTVSFIGLLSLNTWLNFSRSSSEIIFYPSDLKNYSPELGFFLKTPADLYTTNEVSKLYRVMKQENCLYIGDLMLLHSVADEPSAWPITHLHNNTTYFSGDSIMFTALKKQIIENVLRYKMNTVIQDNLFHGEDELSRFLDTLKGPVKERFGHITVFEMDMRSIERVVSTLNIMREK